jgi:anti-sigma factor RsiW
MRCEEASELITALVDSEVTTEERSIIESHLSECLRCRSAYDDEKVLKSGAREAAKLVMAPSELRQRILADHRVFPEAAVPRPGWKGIRRRESSYLRPAWAMAILIVLAVPLYWFSLKQPSLSSELLESHAKVLAGNIGVVRMTSPTALREYLTHAVDGRFGPMAGDLSALGLYPVGGAVREINGRKVILAVFEGTGPAVICYTFAGTENDSPGDAEIFFDSGTNTNFYTFSNGPVNAVMHREGELICIFTSAMPMPQLLALARARTKAHPS